MAAKSELVHGLRSHVSCLVARGLSVVFARALTDFCGFYKTTIEKVYTSNHHDLYGPAQGWQKVMSLASNTIFFSCFILKILAVPTYNGIETWQYVMISYGSVVDALKISIFM